MIQQIGNRVVIEITVQSINPDKPSVDFVLDDWTFNWRQDAINSTTKEFRDDFEMAMMEQFKKDFS